MQTKKIVKQIIDNYKLEAHPEGGYFAEVFTASSELLKANINRPLAGSIYFLLPPRNISHFHQIDCEEIWYYHAGGGLIIYIITTEGNLETKKLGLNYTNGEAPMVVIPQGAIFAAENIQADNYTFISCITTPKFRYEGFRLVPYEEIKKYGIEQSLCLK